MDAGERVTDRELARLEKRLHGVYEQAYRELSAKASAWAKAHEARAEKYAEQLAAGRITQADYDAWMRGQMFMGRQWEARVNQMSESLYHADVTARQMINDGRYEVYAQNANLIAYQLEQGANAELGFGLYDANTVKRLVMEQPGLLPRPTVKKDRTFRWYNSRVNNAVTQGILQGEDMRQIAKRIASSCAEASMTAAVRNARTAYTGAQNAGRMQGMKDAQALGIKVQKQWVATLDNRTRDAHADLDGQVQDVDDPFDSELGPIDYPGDPSADPANTWNCRCTLKYVYPEYPSDTQRRDNETGKVVKNMTYREWEESKQGN